MQVDVFSFGIVMWEILTGEEPYANMHYGAIIGILFFFFFPFIISILLLFIYVRIQDPPSMICSLSQSMLCKLCSVKSHGSLNEDNYLDCSWSHKI